jgi:hypothetical protein
VTTDALLIDRISTFIVVAFGASTAPAPPPPPPPAAAPPVVALAPTAGLPTPAMLYATPANMSLDSKILAQQPRTIVFAGPSGRCWCARRI